MTAARRAGEHGREPDDPAPQERRARGAWVATLCGLAPGALIFGSHAGFHRDGTPWWIYGVLGTLWLATVCLRVVFPQDSRDKVAWWRELWNRPKAPAHSGDNSARYLSEHSARASCRERDISQDRDLRKGQP